MRRVGDLHPSKRPKVRRRLAGGSYWAFCQGTCKEKFPVGELTIDHIIPLKSGGTSTETNLQLLCRDCHDLKDFGCVTLKRHLKRTLRAYIRWLEKRPKLTKSQRRSVPGYGIYVKTLFEADTATLVIRAMLLTLKVLIGTLATLYRRQLAEHSYAITSKTLDHSATSAISTSAGMVPSSIDAWSPKRAKPSLIVSLPLSTRLSKRIQSGSKPL